MALLSTDKYTAFAQHADDVLSAENNQTGGVERLLAQIKPIPPSYLQSLLDTTDELPTLGVSLDVARFGVDRNVAFIRHHNWVIACLFWSGGTDTNQVASVISHMINEWEAVGWVVEYLCIDLIGPGYGVVDELWSRGGRYRTLVKPINVAMAASAEPERFRNAKTEIAWNLRKRFKARNIHFYHERRTFQGHPEKNLNPIPQHVMDAIMLETTTVQYEVDDIGAGKIAVESKKKYKKRTAGKSPDFFDSLALLFNDTFIGLERRPSAMRSIGANFLGR